jgi:hypothetical protein
VLAADSFCRDGGGWGTKRVEILSKSFPDHVSIETIETVRPNHITLHAGK